MNLNEVHRGIQKHKKRRRVGRGSGSGWGKTSGRGHKGQGQLAGWSTHPAFEGGQMPLSRRIPKRGFNNRWARSVFAVNVGDLNERFPAGGEVTVEALHAVGLVHGDFELLKILGNGDLTKGLTVHAHKFSQTARDKITQAGGQVVEVPGPAPVVKGVKRSNKAKKAKDTGASGKAAGSKSKRNK